MRVHVGCRILYASLYPIPMLLVIAPPRHDKHHIVDERRNLYPDVPIHDYKDSFGNHVWRVVAPEGVLSIDYQAIAEVSPLPDPYLPLLKKSPIETLPDDVIVFTLPSRHCPSDLFMNEAWQLFGHVEGGWAQVQAICDWIHTNVTYLAGSTTSTSAWDVYQQRQGVCRDFAHLGITFCRALNFPARYVCGYLPDINVIPDPAPMDFHAWFEVYLEGEWRTFDARHNYPRTGRVSVAHGRDAVDVAFATMFGYAELVGFTIWAEQADDNATL
jgi:transglutaminase-like putative cysteine protease